MGIIGGVVGGVVNAGLGMINSAIEGNRQRKNIDLQNQANMNLAKYQYSTQTDMWNKANEYNTPAAQMQRYKDAGLNPNLIYGQGSNGNSPNVLPQYHAPQLSYDYKPGLNVSSAISDYQDFTIKKAQADNLQEQNKVIKANAIIMQSKAQYANELEDAKAGLASDNQKLVQYKRVLGEQEFYRVFTEPDANNLVHVRPEMEDVFITNLASKWASGPLKVQGQEKELNKTQAQIDNIELQNELQQKKINWFIFNQVSDKVFKLAGLGAVSQAFKKVPDITKNFNKNVYIDK
jgi:hypothetical protein